jgi:hypothetical protein
VLEPLKFVDVFLVNSLLLHWNAKIGDDLSEEETKDVFDRPRTGEVDDLSGSNHEVFRTF